MDGFGWGGRGAGKLASWEKLGNQLLVVDSRLPLVPNLVSPPVILGWRSKRRGARQQGNTERTSLPSLSLFFAFYPASRDSWDERSRSLSTRFSTYVPFCGEGQHTKTHFLTVPLSRMRFTIWSELPSLPVPLDACSAWLSALQQAYVDSTAHGSDRQTRQAEYDCEYEMRSRLLPACCC